MKSSTEETKSRWRQSAWSSNFETLLRRKICERKGYKNHFSVSFRSSTNTKEILRFTLTKVCNLINHKLISLKLISNYLQDFQQARIPFNSNLPCSFSHWNTLSCFLYAKLSFEDVSIELKALHLSDLKIENLTNLG